MSSKIYQLFEYLYIVMFIASIYIVVTNWESNRGQSYLFAFFGVVAVFMFFFKRRFRKNLEKRNREE